VETIHEGKFLSLYCMFITQGEGEGEREEEGRGREGRG